MTGLDRGREGLPADPLLTDLGLLDAAEARDSEAAAKVAEVMVLRPAAGGRPGNATHPSACSSKPAWTATRRGGCPLPQLEALADRVAVAPQLRLEGVMGVAPLGIDSGAAFARLLVAAQRLRRSHPGAQSSCPPG